MDAVCGLLKGGIPINAETDLAMIHHHHHPPTLLYRALQQEL
jgi:hypothetical protein